MKTAEEFVSKWSNWWITNNNKNVLNRAFENELKEIIEQARKEAFEIAFQEGQSNPKIKQLEWEDNENCLTKGITARTSFCTYQTMELLNGNSSLFTDNRIICEDFPIDYIKQYAQEDFERRIKEYLKID